MSSLEKEYIENHKGYIKELQMDGSLLYYSGYVKWLENKVNYGE